MKFEAENVNLEKKQNPNPQINIFPTSTIFFHIS